jgi:hypothetical protein
MACPGRSNHARTTLRAVVLPTRLHHSPPLPAAPTAAGKMRASWRWCTMSRSDAARSHKAAFCSADSWALSIASSTSENAVPCPSPTARGLLASRSRSRIPGGQAPRRRTQTEGAESADARRTSTAKLFGSASHKRLNRSSVGCGAGPAARTLSSSPNATNGATRATRREAWATGFRCGAGCLFLPALSHRLGGHASS